MSDHLKSLIRQRHRDLARSRRAARGWLRTLGRSNRLFPRKLVVTRDGKWIIAMALLLGVGAVNTGNNLLYLVLSLLISIIAISGVLSEANLGRLKVQRRYVRELECGQASIMRTEVLNPKGRASFNIEVDELFEEGMRRRAGYVLHLRPGETGQGFITIEPTRRGPILSEGVCLSTAYPFGFARKTLVFEGAYRWLALPEVWPTRLHEGSATDRGVYMEINRKGAGSELMGLRDWREGDSKRDIHWKASARRSRLIAREWQAEANRAVMVEFVHLAPKVSADLIALDPACSRVAGICASLLEEGLAVGLCTTEELVDAQTDDQGAQLLRIRRALARLGFADQPAPPSWPLEDERWATQVQDAYRQRERLDAGRGLKWWRGSGTSKAFRVRVLLSAHRAVAVDGPAPDVLVSLDADGAVASVTEFDQARGPEAA